MNNNASFLLTNKAARIIILQRIDLASPFLKKIRKLLGRYLFSTFITKYFLNPKDVAKNYYTTMSKEYETLKNYIFKTDQFFLSIGGGIGGLEAVINKNLKNKSFYFIERNFISKKVKYGWSKNNLEAYNNFNIQRSFLNSNDMSPKQYQLIDFDKDNFPEMKFDVVISLFSLDYHYDFNIYINYLKKVSTKNTRIIFDTIRADYFQTIFKNVKIISVDNSTVHKSKRIICREFI